MHMVETINKLLRTQRRMTQELNREPSIEELAKELEMEPEKVEYVMKIKQISAAWMRVSAATTTVKTACLVISLKTKTVQHQKNRHRASY